MLEILSVLDLTLGMAGLTRESGRKVAVMIVIGGSEVAATDKQTQ